MPKDLRQFLEEYERDHPEDVITIERPISLKHEIGILVDLLDRERKFPLLRIKNPILCNGEPSEYEVIMNEIGSRSKLAYAMKSTWENVSHDWRRLAVESKIEPVVIDRSEAPVKEEILKGDDVDMQRYPAYQPYLMLPHPYVSLAPMITYHPEIHVDNMGIHRGEIQGKNKIAFLFSPDNHNSMNFYKHEQEHKKNMKCAVVAGLHPNVLMASQTKMGYPESHFAVCGGMLGEPLRLVASETLGDDFMVPADAEIVIEGEILAMERTAEGPYSEYTRHIGAQRWSPYMEVSCITQRKNPLWSNYAIGRNHAFQGLAREFKVYDMVKQVVPQVTKVYLLPHAGGDDGLGFCFIQMKKTAEGQPKTAIHAALTANYGIKHVIIVDDDIDIYDERMVFWAVATRAQPDKDWVIIKDVMCSIVDPSIEHHWGSKAGIDATRPAPPEPFLIPTMFPEEDMKRIKLDDFVPKEQLDRIPDAFRKVDPEGTVEEEPEAIPAETDPG